MTMTEPQSTLYLDKGTEKYSQQREGTGEANVYTLLYRLK
jgi:hypothetical protein